MLHHLDEEKGNRKLFEMTMNGNLLAKGNFSSWWKEKTSFGNSFCYHFMESLVAVDEFSSSLKTFQRILIGWYKVLALSALVRLSQRWRKNIKTSLISRNKILCIYLLVKLNSFSILLRPLDTARSFRLENQLEIFSLSSDNNSLKFYEAKNVLSLVDSDASLRVQGKAIDVYLAIP